MRLSNKYFSKKKILMYFYFFIAPIMLPIVFITSVFLSLMHKNISIMSIYYLYKFAVIIIISLLLLIKRNAIETINEKILDSLCFLGTFFCISLLLNFMMILGLFNFPWYTRWAIALSIGLVCFCCEFIDKTSYKYGHEEESCMGFLSYSIDRLKIDKLYSLRKKLYKNVFKFNEYQREKIIDSFKIIILIIDRLYIVDGNISEKYVPIYEDCINFLEELTLVTSKYSDLDLSDNQIFDEIHEDAIQFAEVNKGKIEMIAKKDMVTLIKDTKDMFYANNVGNTNK